MSPRVADGSASNEHRDAWCLRRASAEDARAVAVAVHELLNELGSIDPPSTDELAQTAGEIVADRRIGTILLAEAGKLVIGVLAASWQMAMHVPGRYVLIQDLWVHPDWRSQSVGAELVAELCALAGRQGMVRVEVGLPRDDFAAIGETTGFYLRNGFSPLGQRMRRSL